MKSMRVTATLSMFALAGLVFGTPAQANDSYSFYMTIQSETGLVVVQEFPVADPRSPLECNQVKRSSRKVGEVIPRGVLISPGGNSYTWTVTAVACKPSKRYDGEGVN